nr:hypothetical protein [Anatilimnocola floriformis]
MKHTLRYLLVAVLLGVQVCSAIPASAEGWSMTQSWKKLWNPDPKDKKKDQYQVPTRVVALWAPAMYNTPGKPSMRGFGGRLYFYNAKDQPVPVEGQLVVYGFNDSVQRNERKPDRKFVFTSQQLASHFSPAELGASYSVWIPWDAVGGQQMEISLLPVFSANNGQVIMGEQSRNVLPGTTTPAANSTQTQNTVQPFIIDHRVAPASYAAPDDLRDRGATGEIAQTSFYTHATQPKPQEDIRTTSIQLTRGIAERLIQERQQENQLVANGLQLPQSAVPPPNMLPANVPQPNLIQPNNVAPHLPQHSATRSFSAPTADSRSWGPTVQRSQGQPSSPARGQTPVGQSPTRYAPGSLPAPMTTGPQPAGGPPPTQPSPAAPGHLPPAQAQYSPYPSAPAGSNNGFAFGQ